MVRLIRWLIWGDAHVHKWEILERHPTTITQRDLLEGKEELYKTVLYVQKCITCGKLKTFVPRR